MTFEELARFDTNDGDDPCGMGYTYIASIVREIWENNTDKLIIGYGYTDRWDGRSYSGRYITTEDQLEDRLGAANARSIECIEILRVSDKDDNDPDDVHTGDIIGRYHHHDGCNVYVFRALPEDTEEAEDIDEFRHQFKHAEPLTL